MCTRPPDPLNGTGASCTASSSGEKFCTVSATPTETTADRIPMIKNARLTACCRRMGTTRLLESGSSNLRRDAARCVLPRSHPRYHGDQIGAEKRLQQIKQNLAGIY